MRCDFFSPNIINIYIFESKVDTRIPHVIWFECLKILTNKNLCNLYV
jgi:hypothetical protein